jgi:hypothetical protein
VGKNQRFWFFEPVEDLGRQIVVQKRKVNISAQTLSASYVHAKSLLYAFTRSSLHLRPANYDVHERSGSDEGPFHTPTIAVIQDSRMDPGIVVLPSGSRLTFSVLPFTNSDSAPLGSHGYQPASREITASKVALSVCVLRSAPFPQFHSDIASSLKTGYEIFSDEKKN